MFKEVDLQPRLRDAAAVVGFAAVVTAVMAHVATLAVWTYDHGFVPWPGDAPVVGTYPFTAWLVGTACGIGAALVFAARMPTVQRVLAIVFALGCTALLVVTVVLRPHDTNGARVSLPVDVVIGLAAATAAAIAIACRGRTAAATRRTTAGIAAATTVAAIALGGPTLIETHAEYRSQTLRPFTIELVAAYPAPAPAAPGEMPAYVVDATGSPGERVEYDGRTYYLHREDRVVIGSAQVRRVRLFEGGLSIRVGADTARALRARSWSRMSQYDAIVVDGQLVSVPLYEAVITDRLWLADRDAAALARIYQLLVAD